MRGGQKYLRRAPPWRRDASSQEFGLHLAHRCAHRIQERRKGELTVVVGDHNGSTWVPL